MNKKPLYSWDPEIGWAACVLSDGKNEFVGIAQCHPEDADMMSEKTGLTIAEMRAEMSYLKHVRDNEIKPGLAALNQLYYSMNRSKDFNPKNYENRMLRRQIKIKENDLVVINEELTTLKKTLKDMIDEKDLFYKKVRENRKKEIDELFDEGKDN